MPVPLVTTALCTAACAAMQDCNDDVSVSEEEKANQIPEDMPESPANVYGDSFAPSAVASSRRLLRKRKSSVSFQETVGSSATSLHNSNHAGSDRPSGTPTNALQQGTDGGGGGPQQQQQQNLASSIRVPSVHSIFDRKSKKKTGRPIQLRVS